MLSLPFAQLGPAMAPAEAFLMEEEFGAGLPFTDFDPCFLDPWYALNKARAELFSAPPPASAAPAHSEQAQELDAREAARWRWGPRFDGLLVFGFFPLCDL